MTVDAGNPGRGDVAGISAAARERSVKAQTIRDAAAAVDRAIGEANGSVWTGKARESFVAAATILTAELHTSADRLDAEASAFNTYGFGVQEIQNAQRTLELRREEVQGDLARCGHRQDQAERDARATLPLSAESDEAYARSRLLKGQIDDLHGQSAAIEREWGALVERRRSVNATAIASLSGTSVLGPLSMITRGGASVDQVLTQLSAVDLLTLLRTDPSYADRLRAADPSAVAGWWPGLGHSGQDALIAAFPALIGNLEGIAYTARDRANRIWLRQQLADVRNQIDNQSFGSGAGGYGGSGGYETETAIAAALARLRGLEAIQTALRAPKGHAERFLISLTDDKPPLAAVSVGNLDTADSVTWAVPGMGSSAEGLPDWAVASQNLQESQTTVDPDNQHAVVAWVGYNAPPVGGPQVLGTDYAKAGAVNLAASLDGFTATRPVAGLNVVAHSYGTTTASIALTSASVHVDTFVSVGSAGLAPSIDRASDLHADQVFAGQAQDVWLVDPAPGDQWAWFGRAFGDHPVNPVSDSFGAQTFGVDSGAGGAPVTDHGVNVEAGSGYGYLDLNTESIRNVAYATTGQATAITPAVDHGPTPFQQAIIGASGAY